MSYNVSLEPARRENKGKEAKQSFLEHFPEKPQIVKSGTNNKDDDLCDFSDLKR